MMGGTEIRLKHNPVSIMMFWPVRTFYIHRSYILIESWMKLSNSNRFVGNWIKVMRCGNSEFWKEGVLWQNTRDCWNLCKECLVSQSAGGATSARCVTTAALATCRMGFNRPRS